MRSLLDNSRAKKPIYGWFFINSNNSPPPPHSPEVGRKTRRIFEYRRVRAVYKTVFFESYFTELPYNELRIIIIVTCDSLQLSVESFTGIASDMSAHAKTYYVNIVGGLRRVIGQRFYKFGHIVPDSFAPQSGHKIWHVQRDYTPVHAHQVVVCQREIFWKRKTKRKSF